MLYLQCMAKCKKCGDLLPEQRRELGYSVCIACSTEKKWTGVHVIHHKTGNEVDIIKDPEVAAEFVAMSKRSGFGALRSMVGSAKKLNVASTSTRSRKLKPAEFKSFAVIVDRKKVQTNYQDDTLGLMILEKLENEGRETAIQELEREFRALNISPICRKRLLHILENAE